MKKNLVLLVLALPIYALAPSSALANDTSNGCGLGWQVSSKQSLVSSSVRATTNAFLPNTFSMTFGTSGCAHHTIVKNDEKAVLYAANNGESLAAELAEGRGEFLDGFTVALGCDVQTASELKTHLQSKYQQIVPIQSADSGNYGIELYQHVRTEIQATPKLRQGCQPKV